MKCDLSQYNVTTLDSVMIGSHRISSQLMDWWILFTKVPASPLTGNYLTDEELANVLMLCHIDLQPTLRSFEKPSNSSSAWTTTELPQLRMSFWTYCMSQVMQETVSDNLAQDELMYTTKLVLHGAITECPTQTLNDLVSMYKACLEPAEDVRQSLDVSNLKCVIHITMRHMMLHSKPKTLEMLSQTTLPNLEPQHAQLIHTLLTSSFHEEYLELLGF